VVGLHPTETAAGGGGRAAADTPRPPRARGLVQAAIEERVGAAAAQAFELHAGRCDRVVAAVLGRLPGPP
jgi:hypothetical protein